jgi:NADPH-dependent glutamate synthase beta subunit-like oxidoreductase
MKGLESHVRRRFDAAISTTNLILWGCTGIRLQMIRKPEVTRMGARQGPKQVNANTKKTAADYVFGAASKATVHEFRLAA